MQFLGLGLSTLLSIGAAFGAAVTLLYILKLRRRAVAVPFSKIWDRVLRDQQATSLFSQLKRLFSLLLQLILLALIVLALGDPRLTQNSESARHIVVLVDASASMKATDEKPTRLSAATLALSAMIDGLGGSDRMLVAKMDATVTPLSTMTDDVPSLKRAASLIHASDTRSDLKRAISFALDSLRGLPNPEILVFSDGALDDIESLDKQALKGKTSSAGTFRGPRSSWISGTPRSTWWSWPRRFSEKEARRGESGSTSAVINSSTKGVQPCWPSWKRSM
jgi:hypothetical protein